MNTITIDILQVLNLITIVLVSVGGYFIRRLDKETETLREDVENIRKELGVYERSVAVGTVEISSIRDMLDGHIKREEGETWGKLDGIAEQLGQMQLENERAHSSLNDRIARLETRVVNGVKTSL